MRSNIFYMKREFTKMTHNREREREREREIGLKENEREDNMEKQRKKNETYENIIKYDFRIKEQIGKIHLLDVKLFH